MSIQWLVTGIAGAVLTVVGATYNGASIGLPMLWAAIAVLSFGAIRAAAEALR